MKLPRDEIGISDILDYRECPQRFEYAMRRHLPMPEEFKKAEGETANPPDREGYAGAYGNAIHDAIEIVEKTQCSDKEAIDAVWPIFNNWLEPDDESRMLADLETYRTRSQTGYRLIGTEIELRAPLFVHNGVTIYFRGRIDVLLQRLDNPAVFLSRDYKSSRWPKSEEEVHKDIQQWAYNWLVHETYPECETLVQLYDQLRYGDIPTRKSPEQREQIKRWLIRQVTAILEDTTFKPKANDFCSWCPLVMDCRVTHMTADWWRNRLAALAPERKEGRKAVLALNTEHYGIETYVDMLPKAKLASKHLEKFIGEIERVLKDMPQDERDELGYTLGKPRQYDTFDAQALRQIAQLTGDDFFHLVGITKKAVEDFYGTEEGSPRAEIEALSRKRQTAPSLKKK
jgi:hypothetical protein